MDPGEYLPMFVAECREHLQELNLAIVALEKNPDDAAGVDAIFRVVHSVKGMAGTMGFDGMARLTHELEDVFELIRQRRGGIEHAAIDIVLECLDVLSDALDAIERDGQESIDPEPLIPRVRSLVRAPDTRSAQSTRPAAALVHTEEGLSAFRVDFNPDTQMRAVLAYILISTLRQRGLLVASEPTEDDLDGWTETRVELVCVADATLADITSVADEIDGVKSVKLMRGAAPVAAAERAVDVAASAITAQPDGSDQAGPESAAGPSGPAHQAGGSHLARSRTVRVDAERLDQLMHYMGELVVHRTQLAALVAQADVPGIAQAMQELERTSQALRTMVMKVRMIEVEAVFARLPRLVRDVAGKLGKEVELSLTGADTELDRSVVDSLGDPLVHLVRNAIDHGLETSEERVAAGKPPAATLAISARQAGGGVVIRVQDDGRGVDPAKVAARARRNGLAVPAGDLTVEQAIELLFRPGFSTAKERTDISGRGVGLDAARDAVRALGGDVTLQSTAGVGTVAEIRLPLTLAITSALLVEVAGQPFAVPLDRVEWTLALADHNVRMAAGQAMIVLPDGVVPLCDGARVLAGCAATAPAEHAVIVRSGETQLGIAVGELIGQRELVTRPLPPELELSRPVSAGAVLAEGAIALIVDCEALAQVVAGEEGTSYAIAA
ncbi:MAG: chemotaxis protein CheA [Solirubrobacteraceae bacterium]|jgi:two-component system chemotaxis sensor kinase CheA